MALCSPCARAIGVQSWVWGPLALAHDKLRAREGSQSLLSSPAHKPPNNSVFY